MAGYEWDLVVPREYHDHEVCKIDDLKFFVCPVDFITRRTWNILGLVNETTNLENGALVHLPFPGSYLEQPEWFREAVKIKRCERNSDWFHEALRKKYERHNRP